ncbi:MAG TPA: F0F1 ATP synthase subunit gamma [Syntrophales bacterium]|nr:F0F1 ATP synthase subunit gamma [Syntrophales bacterium]
MQTIESLKRKIKSAEDLLSVVKTMKALAAVSIRQYQRSVESLSDYNRTVEMGLQVALQARREIMAGFQTEAVGSVGAIVFGTDQGLCGQLNEQVASHALDTVNAMRFKKEDSLMLTVGMRVSGYLEDAGQPIVETIATPSSTAGITPVVQDIILAIEDWHFRRQISHVLLFYCEYLSGASYRPHSVRLLPVDGEWLRKIAKKKWSSRTLPIFTMDWEKLFSALIREYLFVSLYRAFAESLASESASRLASMQNAEKNIGERLDDLHSQFHRQRQMTITEELLDIVAGFEALEVRKTAVG